MASSPTRRSATPPLMEPTSPGPCVTHMLTSFWGLYDPHPHQPWALCGPLPHQPWVPCDHCLAGYASFDENVASDTIGLAGFVFGYKEYERSTFPASDLLGYIDTPPRHRYTATATATATTATATATATATGQLRTPRPIPRPRAESLPVSPASHPRLPWASPLGAIPCPLPKPTPRSPRLISAHLGPPRLISAHLGSSRLPSALGTGDWWQVRGSPSWCPSAPSCSSRSGRSRRCRGWI